MESYEMNPRPTREEGKQIVKITVGALVVLALIFISVLFVESKSESMKAMMPARPSAEAQGL